ncbi:MAG: GspH/FimT family pseudopilin [Ramlibacter sp.]
MKIRGFTLVELLVAMAILAILTALATPSFKRIIQSNAISNGVNTFLADMRYARSEAIRLGGGVVMCRSDAPEAANPTCGSGSGPGGNGWISGWIIFHDLDNSLQKANTEPLLRVQAPITNIDSVVESGSSTRFRFTATGRLQNLSSITSLQFGGGDFTADRQRVVCVSVGGRARIAGDGNAGC